ncbi:MAG: ABC-type uncharacterized transport system permease subunit [Chlamydiales bacterium]
MTAALVQALGVALPVLYLLSAILYGMAFAGSKQPPFVRMRRLLLLCTVVAHAGFFIAHWQAAGTLPDLSTWLLLSAVVLAMVSLFLVISLRAPQPAAASIVLTLACILQFPASAFGPLHSVPPIARTTSTSLVALHACTSVLAAASVLLSGVYGCIYLLLYRQMRANRFGPLYQQLPDLSLSARMTRRAALAGFLLLSVGLNLGIWIAHRDSVADFNYTDPTVLMTMAIWIHFGFIAFSQVIRGVTARRASIAAVAGLIVLTLALSISLLPSLSFHSRP